MKIIFVVSIVLFASLFVSAQKKPVEKPTPTPASNTQSAVKSSPAYAEILLQKTELSAELENLLLEYTEDYPKVKEIRFTLGLAQKDLEKLLAVTDASKLSLALGKMLVRKNELSAELWNLQRQFADEHPDVKRARRKVEVFEQAIKEILP
jgi:uncharacterized protein involved in exopolysaccharide biosynthesis